MKMFDNILLNLAIVFRPKYWITNHGYNEVWDRELNRLLDEHIIFTNVSEHTAYLGNVCIWIANHPYASFVPYSRHSINPKYRASRKTVYRAYKRLRVSSPRSKEPDVMLDIFKASV